MKLVVYCEMCKLLDLKALYISDLGLSQYVNICILKTYFLEYLTAESVHRFF